MAPRTNFGELFLEFLKAQNHLEAFNKLDSDNVSDATINSIFSKYRADFDAWLKIPRSYKDAYGRAKPYMMEAAKNDPNFTESDAKAAQKEYDSSQKPYSVLPKEFSSDSLLRDIFDSKMVFTPAHAAALSLHADYLRSIGYSNKASDQMAIDNLAVKTLFEKRKQIEDDESLSEAQKQKKLTKVDEKINPIRKRKLKTGKQDVYKNIPERGVMIALRACKMGKLDINKTLNLVDSYAEQISKTGRMEELAHEMSGPRFTKVLKDEQRSILYSALEKHGIDIKTLESIAGKSLIINETALAKPAPVSQAIIQNTLNQKRDRNG